MVIDAHHHFWKYEPAEYPWIDASMERIRRDFLPADLLVEMGTAGIDGVVSVQARTSLEETRQLLEFARVTPCILGVVGWVPLQADDLTLHLEEWAADPKFRGVREVMQGRPYGALLQDDFQAGLRALLPHGLVYDLLIYADQLPEAAELVRLHPSQVFVLDHAAKPPLRGGDLREWEVGIRRLASAPNVYCKLSGLVTEAVWDSWSSARLRTCFETVLQCFGAERVMFGSDWPVCLLASSYVAWKETVVEWLSDFPTSDRACILGETARRVYQLHIPEKT